MTSGSDTVETQSPAATGLLLASAALNEVAVGVMIVDVRRSGQPTVFLNDRFSHDTGYALEDLQFEVDRHKIIETAENDPASLEKLGIANLLGKPDSATLRIRRKDGRRIWYLITAVPIRSARGETTHIVATGSDVTDAQKRAPRAGTSHRAMRALRSLSDSVLRYAALPTAPVACSSPAK